MRDLTSKAIAYATASSLVVGVGGIGIIKEFEGKRNKAYLDAVGVPTICYGSTSGVKLGQYKTDDECEILVNKEINKFGQEVATLIKVPVSQQQYDAVVSLAYNVGTTNLRKSTLLRKLNAGDYCGSAKEFNKWVYAGGKKLKGLERRRLAEQQMFILGTKGQCKDVF